MTDRKLTCAACKSAITKGDIAGSDLEFGGEIKATNQPTYASDADTDLLANIGTLDEYTPMVRTTGNQTISGVKSFYNSITQVSPTIDITLTPDPDNYLIGANINFVDKNNVNWISLRPIKGSDGKSTLQAVIRRNDGTYDYLNIITSTA